MRTFFVPAISLGRRITLRKLGLKKVSSIVVLGLVPAVSPFGMCVHIPFLNQISSDLAITTFAVQNTITVYMFVFSLAIFATAFVADIVSKRTLLLVSLLVFSAASFLGAAAPSFEILMIARCLQAMAAGIIVVMPYAIIQEIESGAGLVKSVATISIIHSLMCSVIPLLGGVLTWFFDWRAAFWISGVYAAGMFMVEKNSQLPEVHKKPESVEPSLLLGRVRKLIAQRQFLCSLVILSFGSALYYGFISVAPVIVSEKLQASEFVCGALLFAMCAFWTIGNRVASIFQEKYGCVRALLLALGLIGIGLIPLLFINGGTNLFSVLSLMIPYAIGGGILSPIIVATATSSDPKLAGVASSLLFSTQVMVGSLAAWFCSFFDLSSLKDITVFGMFTALVCLLAFKIMFVENFRPRIKVVEVEP